jgi:hypothetical protein
MIKGAAEEVHRLIGRESLKSLIFVRQEAVQDNFIVGSVILNTLDRCERLYGLEVPNQLFKMPVWKKFVQARQECIDGIIANRQYLRNPESMEELLKEDQETQKFLRFDEYPEEEFWVISHKELENFTNHCIAVAEKITKPKYKSMLIGITNTQSIVRILAGIQLHYYNGNTEAILELIEEFLQLWKKSYKTFAFHLLFVMNYESFKGVISKTISEASQRYYTV